MKWRFFWLVIGILFIASCFKLGYYLWRDEGVIGEVHLLRDRQMVQLDTLWKGPMGRLVANKPVIVFNRMKLKILEAVDLNILFFAGHPNERVGVEENEWLVWWVVPFSVWGMIQCFVLGKYEFWSRLLVGIWILGITWAINFDVINGVALLGVLLAIYGLVGVGMYDGFFAFYRLVFTK